MGCCPLIVRMLYLKDGSKRFPCLTLHFLDLEVTVLVTHQSKCGLFHHTVNNFPKSKNHQQH